MDILLPLFYKKDAVIGRKVRYTKNGKTYYRALPGEGKEDVPKGRRKRAGVGEVPQTRMATATKVAKVAGIVGVATLGTAIAGGATALSIPPITYAAAVNKYRSNMAKNRQEIVTEGEKLAQQFQEGVKIMEQNKEKYPELFTETGKINPKFVWKLSTEEQNEIYSTLPGLTEQQKEYLSEPNNKSYRMGYANAVIEDSIFHQVYNNNKQHITIVANGFDGQGNDSGAHSVIADIQDTRKRKQDTDTNFDNHAFVPISNEGFSPGNDLEGIGQVLKNNLKKGRNEVAQRMAIQAYAFHKAFPNQQINLVGYSGAGMATNEVAEQLESLKVKARVVNYGSPWFGVSRPPLQGKYVQSITFNTPYDHATPLSTVANEVNINGVKDHFTYLSHPKVRELTKQFLNGGSSAKEIQAQSDSRSTITPKEWKDKKKRKEAIMRSMKSKQRKAEQKQQEDLKQSENNPV